MSNENDPTQPTNSFSLSVDTFVRSIEVNKQSPHAFFLGAGASISSGIQSAYSCIWDWKRMIFLTNNPGLEAQFSDLSVTSVRQRIQEWLDSEGRFAPFDSPEEYSRYAELCYPIAQDRRRFFQNLARQAIPYVGYQLLALLAEAEIVKSVWTTNFDGLTAKALATNTSLSAIEVGLDSVERVIRQPQRGELLCISIHGDYRYDELKNTNAELRIQDETLRQAMCESAANMTFIICGYSGRDHSVMESFTQAYLKRGSGRLFWCGMEQPEPNEEIKALLRTARTNGRDAYYVPTNGFDDLLIRLSLACLTDRTLEKALNIRSQLAQSTEACPPFTLETTPITTVIKSNAFAVECPADVLYFKSDHFKVKGGWSLLKERIAGKEIVAGLVKDGVLALGKIDEVKKVFDGLIDGDIKATPISEKELLKDTGVLTSILTQALVQSIAKASDVATDGKKQIWAKTSGQNLRIKGIHCLAYDAAKLFIRTLNGKQYLVIEPTIKGTDSQGNPIGEDVEKELKRLILTKQWNKQYNEAVNHWRDKIFKNGTLFHFPQGSDSACKFTVRKAPLYAGLASTKRPIVIPSKFKRHIFEMGREFLDTSLKFSRADGKGFVTDINPIRGIVHNRPFDFELTRRGLEDKVSLGVVCPKRDSIRLSNYLQGLQLQCKPNTKGEYLLDYPGYAMAFGVPLIVPSCEMPAWFEIPEVVATDNKMGAKEIASNIINGIKVIKAAGRADVILIYIPKRWENWRSYKTDDERFDLHDFVKAYCVQHGIATQFLEEDTLGKTNKCEILWWLALSFYAKSMRTPWVLDGLDKSTVFMGIGYSVDTCTDKDERIVLGCSHIYSAEGLGLKYALSKVENPIIRHQNPFMSRDDARRLGDKVRQLFFDSQSRPQRVVIHKRNYFGKEEREGLLEGLAGIPQIDMLEINIESALRFVSSRFVNNLFQDDAFPVRRGTAILLDKRKALVWVHGATQATSTNLTYYQGKSRIPAPLVIVRHHGNTSLSVLVKELLGFTKMDWNTFDMYTKLPATINSSNAIARIGSLLERFTEQSYDYRLFM